MSIPDSLLRRKAHVALSEGRLQQTTLDLLAGSDINFRREPRLDIALVKNHEIALIFLPAADIPTFVGEGRVDLGITGRDQVAEYHALTPSGEEHGVEEILDLGFGACRLQIQVPARGDIYEPKDLIGKNVCSSFIGLTEKYFEQLEKSEGKHVSKEPPTQDRLWTKIMYLSGSVEAACALGVADGIVDLVGQQLPPHLNLSLTTNPPNSESGETMKAAGLKAIDTVIESTAVLIKSKHPSNPKIVDLVASRINGVISESHLRLSHSFFSIPNFFFFYSPPPSQPLPAAQKYVLLQYNVPRSLLEAVTRITPGKRAPTITALEDADWVAVSAMVEKKLVATVMDELIACGAADLLVLDIKNSRTA